MWVRWPIMCSTTSRRRRFRRAGRRHAELRLGPDRRGRCHRPCLSPKSRAFYNLEKMWARARQGRDAQAKGPPATPFV